MFPTRTRPGVLTFIGVVSLIWSALALVGVAIGTVVLVAIGAGSWIGGPAAGAVGTVIAGGVILLMLVYSILSILLFRAGWLTLRDDPAGVRLHRLWAWITLGLEVATLIFSGGTAPHSWASLIYAGAVLYITGLPEVRAYFGGPMHGKPAKAFEWVDDLA